MVRGDPKRLVDGHALDLLDLLITSPAKQVGTDGRPQERDDGRPLGKQRRRQPRVARKMPFVLVACSK